jgi:hypothetical protein
LAPGQTGILLSRTYEDKGFLAMTTLQAKLGSARLSSHAAFAVKRGAVGGSLIGLSDVLHVGLGIATLSIETVLLWTVLTAGV